MNSWIKKPVTKQQVDPLCDAFGLEQFIASIMVRRNITKGSDILYYTEDDLRFQHSPFCFNSMEDAVERILQAKDDGEKVLIFGDKDADGVTSTAILYTYLKKLGIDVQWRLPVGDDAYGLSIKAVDDFAAQEGTLIITVDCGISNNIEIDHANDLGIDVIITDHHNAPEQLPAASIIIDPKMDDSGYPFKDISGAAVAYKLVSALRFAESDFYNAEICFLELSEDRENNSYNVDCIKIKNLVKIRELHEKITEKTSIYDLKLPYFLQGQMIYTWDKSETLKILKNIFGSGIEFNLFDFKSEVSKIIPSLKNKSSSDLQKLSTIAKYYPEENTIINSIFNLYVTYCKKVNFAKYPEQIEDEKKDLQLVSLAAIADIMPLQNENRIFIKNGVAAMKTSSIRYGLSELFARLKINYEILTATDLSWSVTPALNAAGRLGQADLTLKLLISENPMERNSLADQIYELNEQRKNLVNEPSFRVHDVATKSIEELENKICLVVDEQIHPGVTGNFAGKLMQEFNVPVIIVTKSDNVYKGSMRSCRGLVTTEYLSGFGDFFINFGGHDCAAGFSFEPEKLPQFIEKIKSSLAFINLQDENPDIYVDAEIPPSYFSLDFFNMINIFEPFGAENPELIFMSKNVPLVEGVIVGKKDPMHLKLVFEFGKFKIPAMLWGQGEKWGKEIYPGKKYDILYTMSKNYYKGTVTNQFIIKEIKESF